MIHQDSKVILVSFASLGIQLYTKQILNLTDIDILNTRPYRTILNNDANFGQAHCTYIVACSGPVENGDVTDVIKVWDSPVLYYIPGNSWAEFHVIRAIFPTNSRDAFEFSVDTCNLQRPHSPIQVLRSPTFSYIVNELSYLPTSDLYRASGVIESVFRTLLESTK